MSLTVLGKNIALDGLGITEASLHSGDPTDAGTALEISGGGYSRQAILFDSASGGSINSDTNPVFSVEGGTQVSHYAFWNGSNQCIDQGALSSSESFSGDGEYTLTDADIHLTDA